MKFTSPLVVRPKAKQIAYCLFAGIVLACLQIYTIAVQLRAGHMLAVLSAALLLIACVPHVWIVVRHIRHDVTAMIPTVTIIAAAQIVRNFLYLIRLESIGFAAILMFVLEIAFWFAFIPCTVRAICGKYKLLVPLVFLFFAFFYAFIKYELRDFTDLASQICLLLILWFPIDAIAFTSLYPGTEKF